MHFTTFVNILPKLRYFEGRNDIQIGYKSYSVLLFSQETYERWGHLGFLERGKNLRKGGVDLEKEGYDPPYQLCQVYTNFQPNKISKDNEHCTCLSITLLDSILVNSDKKYPQIFSNKCKYTIKNDKYNY